MDIAFLAIFWYKILKGELAMKISKKTLRARRLALKTVSGIQVVKVDAITGEITLKAKSWHEATRVFSYEMSLNDILRQIPDLIGGRIIVPQLKKFAQHKLF